MSERKTAKDFHPETLRLFDRYVHGDISRREFLTGTAKFAVAGVTALSILEALTPDYALGQQVKPDDKGLSASFVEFPSPNGNGTVRGYLVKPATATVTTQEKLPVARSLASKKTPKPF